MHSRRKAPRYQLGSAVVRGFCIPGRLSRLGITSAHGLASGHRAKRQAPVPPGPASTACERGTVSIAGTKGETRPALCGIALSCSAWGYGLELEVMLSPLGEPMQRTEKASAEKTQRTDGFPYFPSITQADMIQPLISRRSQPAPFLRAR